MQTKALITSTRALNTNTPLRWTKPLILPNPMKPPRCELKRPSNGTPVCHTIGGYIQQTSGLSGD